MIAVQNCVVQSGLSPNPLFLYSTDYSSVFGFEILIAHHVPKVCVLKGVFVVLILGQLVCFFILCNWESLINANFWFITLFHVIPLTLSDTLPRADVGSIKEAPGVLVSCLSHTLPLIFSVALGSDLRLWGNFYDPVFSGLIPLTYTWHHSFLYSWFFGDKNSPGHLIFHSWWQDETLKKRFPPLLGFQLPCLLLTHRFCPIKPALHLLCYLWLTFFLFSILFYVFCSVL